MGDNTLSCRGCLAIVNNYHSLERLEIKSIFMECTSIQILPDHTVLPQQICSDCYTKCQQWKTFKNMCQDVNQRLQATYCLHPKTEPIEEEIIDDSAFAELITGGPMLIPVETILGPEYETQPGPHKQSSLCPPPARRTRSTGNKCPICKKQFPELWKHILEVHVSKGKPITCPICSKSFKSNRNLREHLLVHTKDEPYDCTLCPEKFARRNNLKTHFRIKHRQGSTESQTLSGVYKCPLCDRLGTKSYLRMHFVVHTNERPYQCKYCKEDFNQKRDCKKHFELFHSDQHVEDGVMLKEGSIFHNPNPWEEMGCSLDEEEDKKEDSVDREEEVSTKPLNTTRRTRRLQGFPTCNQCHQKFVSPVECKRHMDTHGQRETHPFECEVCGNSFEKREQLRQHGQSHSDLRPFVCKVCGADFKRNDHLIRHTNYRHLNMKR